jgi:acetyl esterase/lipase
MLSPKTEPFFHGYELLDPVEFSEFLYPKSESLAPIAQSLPTCFGPDSPTPGMPSNPRMKVSRMWLQLGVFLDYWTGCHEPSVSATLRALLPEKGNETGLATIDPRLHQALPPSAHAIFPELLVNSEWPPVMLIHCSNDSAVPIRSSRVMHARLLDAKVETTLRIVDSPYHSFDLNDGAQEAFGELFNEAIDFLRAALDVT